MLKPCCLLVSLLRPCLEHNFPLHIQTHAQTKKIQTAAAAAAITDQFITGSPDANWTHKYSHLSQTDNRQSILIMSSWLPIKAALSLSQPQPLSLTRINISNCSSFFSSFEVNQCGLFRLYQETEPLGRSLYSGVPAASIPEDHCPFDWPGKINFEPPTPFTTAQQLPTLAYFATKVVCS